MPEWTRRKFLSSTAVAGLAAAGTWAAVAETKGRRPGSGIDHSSRPDGFLHRPYTDPTYFTDIPWGSYSHWLQPWRAYLETMPASTFLEGTGINFNVNPEQADLVAEMLGRHGIRHARMEMGWGSMSYENESQPWPYVAKGWRILLLACQKHGLRPLILLNSNGGMPCPCRQTYWSPKLSQDAKVGQRWIVLDSTTDIRPGYTGLGGQGYAAAFPLIVSVDSHTGRCELSAPLRKALKKGPLHLLTLKYRPFSPPDTADYKATIAGWQRYAGNVARFVAGTLGTTGQSDLGFDMEIWNEMTFGDQFLRVNGYYDPPLYPHLGEPTFLWGLGSNGITPRTMVYVEAHPELLRGVKFGDGFSNTLPWQASSNEPARVGAIDKHPYAGRKTYPLNPPYGGTPINALGQVDHSGFIPHYSELFPEYFACALQTETMVRDLRPNLPGVRDPFDKAHGRYARVIDGKVDPCWVWITEVMEGPVEDDPKISVARALALKAKSTARYFCFYLNKGVTQLDLFAAAGGDKDLGIVLDKFLAHASQPGAVYPADDRPYTSPALAVTARITARMRQHLDPALTVATTRPLKVLSIRDTHDHYQFAGDGTPEHPNLYDRDVLAILPFQVNPTRFVIAYYVMTRDYTKDLAPEEFTVELGGVRGLAAQVEAYDPIRDRPASARVRRRAANALTLKLTAADYPYLLTIQE